MFWRCSWDFTLDLFWASVTFIFTFSFSIIICFLKSLISKLLLLSPSKYFSFSIFLLTSNSRSSAYFSLVILIFSIWILLSSFCSWISFWSFYSLIFWLLFFSNSLRSTSVFIVYSSILFLIVFLIMSASFWICSR